MLLPKKTFLGFKPLTAQEMYVHTRCVNSYYFGEINVDADQEGAILACRQRGFEALEQQENFLSNPVFLGSGDEYWSLRKVLRRFIWHDRIHAKAMYRMAEKTFGEGAVPVGDYRFFCSIGTLPANGDCSIRRKRPGTTVPGGQRGEAPFPWKKGCRAFAQQPLLL